MRCHHCGGELGQGAKFCSQCGQKIEKHCPMCGEVIEETARFCPFCGELLDKDKMVLQETNKSEQIEDEFSIKRERIEKDVAKGKNSSDDEVPIGVYFIVIVVIAVVLFMHFDSLKNWIGTITKPRPVPTLKDNVQPPYGKMEDEFQKFTGLWDEYCNIEYLRYEEDVQIGILDSLNNRVYIWI